eukprot:TRINITY_DN1667_c0_g2_i1.p1 TRINITY_DN1667_c0_g2~~TRINITY_DN1667_c0_g2_i1.p1  ORF type:complete len:336 (-),score=12.09 TRINITY_DN1667_c0_g2_i1:6-908(-)
MDTIFIQDVWKVILRESDTCSIGRLSLTQKGAAKMAWSVAPSVQIGLRNAPTHPFKSIFQYTSSNLIEVSLDRHEDYTIVLSHLLDRCPCLQSLAITDKLFFKFKSMRSRLAGIMPRLLKFVVNPTSDYRFEFPDSSWSRILLEMFEKYSTPIKISHLALDFPFDDSQLTDYIQWVFPKVPNLRCLHLRISLERAQELLPWLPNLESLRVQATATPSNLQIMVDLLRPFFSTPKPLKVTFSGSSMSLTRYLICRGLTEFKPLDALKAAGAKAKNPFRELNDRLDHLCMQPNSDQPLQLSM